VRIAQPGCDHPRCRRQSRARPKPAHQPLTEPPAISPTPQARWARRRLVYRGRPRREGPRSLDPVKLCDTRRFGGLGDTCITRLPSEYVCRGVLPSNLSLRHIGDVSRLRRQQPIASAGGVRELARTGPRAIRPWGAAGGGRMVGDPRGGQDTLEPRLSRELCRLDSASTSQMRADHQHRND